MQGTSAGIDWASEEHALCVVDAAGGKLAGELFAHDEAGLRELIARMRTLGVERVAIERPDGLLVDRLLEAGFTVLPVHPNALKATRPRYEAAGGKSDGFDAFCLAELARTDSHRLRALRPDSDETKALRALTRTREDLVAARVRLGNELRAQLDAFWAGLVAALKPIVTQIAELTSQIAGAVRAHPDSQVFLPLFKDPKSTITAARLVAEIGDDRSRYPTSEALAADAGMAPVARESGKRKVAAFRWACDKRLREAVACLADSTRHHHPWAREVYARARSRGLDHPHAIRVLGRAWLRVLWRCWQDEVPYDPAKHGNLRRLQPAGG
jgi:transposase